MFIYYNTNTNNTTTNRHCTTSSIMYHCDQMLLPFDYFSNNKRVVHQFCLGWPPWPWVAFIRPLFDLFDLVFIVFTSNMLADLMRSVFCVLLFFNNLKLLLQKVSLSILALYPSVTVYAFPLTICHGIVYTHGSMLKTCPWPSSAEW